MKNCRAGRSSFLRLAMLPVPSTPCMAMVATPAALFQPTIALAVAGRALAEVLRGNLPVQAAKAEG